MPTETAHRYVFNVLQAGLQARTPHRNAIYAMQGSILLETEQLIAAFVTEERFPLHRVQLIVLSADMVCTFLVWDAQFVKAVLLAHFTVVLGQQLVIFALLAPIPQDLDQDPVQVV